MNKILAVNHFKLPQELIYYICSFAFYTLEQLIAKNKKCFNEVVHDINSTHRICYSSSGSMYNMYYTINILNPNLYGNQQIDICLTICMCGEYCSRTNLKSKCKCSLI